MTILLSRRARRDLDEIRRHTVETWGREQWPTCYEGLVRTFERLAADPDGGRDRSLFAPGLRSLACWRQLMFLARIAGADDAPVVLPIVRQRRNLPALAYS